MSNQDVRAHCNTPQQGERKNRRSIRLKHYDYSQNGAYFVTICVHNRECLFGDIVDGGMWLNDAGNLVLSTWRDLPNHNAGIELDEFIIMPNHVHGIIIVVGAGSKPALHSNPTAHDFAEPARNMDEFAQNNRAGLEPAPTDAGGTGVKLSEIMRQLKTFSARRINEYRKTPGQPVWQRNYYEHIIRNEQSLDRIREYIQNNPLQWELDENNPDNCRGGFQTRPQYEQTRPKNNIDLHDSGQVWNLPLHDDGGIKT